MDLETNGEQDNGEGLDQLSMEELMESSLQTLKEGEVVRGTVVAISAEEIMIDIGFKCEGCVPVSEFTDRESGEISVKVNDEVEIFVERLDEEGRLRLSRDRATKLQTWRTIEEAFRSGTPVSGKVIERVKGGLSVDIGVRAFLPGSLVDLRPNRRLEDYIDAEIEAKIISFDRRRSNVVLSRKAILEEEQGKVKEETLSTLDEGKVVNGAVKNITDYGVFVDLGGLDGLLHITDISWGRVGHPSEYFQVGDAIDVVILRFDRDRERVSLGYKQRFEDPWILVPEKYPVGKKVTGKVVSIVDYGAFVVLEEGVEGLIHVSEMSWTKKVKNPRSILEAGEEIEVVVSEVDTEKRRLSLSIRATEPNPWEQVAEIYQTGSKIHGVVRNLTDFGAFVEIIPGVDGLVHISDMSWTRRINHPSEVVQKGQEVDAVITSVDVVNQRISLSMKELLPNEWEEYANSHGVGDVVPGSVTNITDFGVFVELAAGVEGLCHISEIDRDTGLTLAETFVAAQKVWCRILRIDWNENRIGLSMHSVSQAGDSGEEEKWAAESEAASKPAETAMAAALKAGGLLEMEDADEAVSAETTEEAVETAASDLVDEVLAETGAEEDVEAAAAEVEEVVEETAAEVEEVVEEAAAEVEEVAEAAAAEVEEVAEEAAAEVEEVVEEAAAEVEEVAEEAAAEVEEVEEAAAEVEEVAEETAAEVEEVVEEAEAEVADADDASVDTVATANEEDEESADKK